MKTTRYNPDWTNHILNTYWGEILAKVGPRYMPISRNPPTIDYKEYGCGYFGCVFPTKTKNLVLKITTDVSEAEFISVYLKNPKRYPGLVRYRRMLFIPHYFYKGKPIFLVWRDEAVSIGLKDIANEIKKAPEPFSTNMHKDLKTFATILLMLYQESTIMWDVHTGLEYGSTIWAESAKLLPTIVSMVPDPSVPPRDWYGPERRKAFAWSLYLYSTRAVWMRDRTTLGKAMGETFLRLFHDGILLCDVHHENIGLPVGTHKKALKGPRIIITDPGLALFMDKRHEPLAMETLF